jgi:hypothetical protein
VFGRRAVGGLERLDEYYSTAYLHGSPILSPYTPKKRRHRSFARGLRDHASERREADIFKIFIDHHYKVVLLFSGWRNHANRRHKAGVPYASLVRAR